MKTKLLLLNTSVERFENFYLRAVLQTHDKENTKYKIR